MKIKYTFEIVGEPDEKTRLVLVSLNGKDIGLLYDVNGSIEWIYAFKPIFQAFTLEIMANYGKRK